MSTLTPEQRREIESVGHVPIEGGAYVVLKAEDFHRLREIAEQERREVDILLARSRRNRLDWIAENPY